MQPADRTIGDARILVGPTAVGKSGVAQWLAERNGWVVLSADSMLVYRGMDIGVAKPSVREREQVKYFGVDVVNPDEAYSTGAFLREANRAWSYCLDSGRELLVAGGTGLYVKALLNGLDAPATDKSRRIYWTQRLEDDGLASLQDELRERWPEEWKSLADTDNPRRCIRALEIAESGGSAAAALAHAVSPVAGLWREPDMLAIRIEQRARAMLSEGLLEETRQLLAVYGALSATAAQAIGYAEAQAVLNEELTIDEALQKICARTRRLAKRQRTWFRHQVDVDWVHLDDDTVSEIVAGQVMEKWEQNGTSKIILPGS